MATGAKSGNSMMDALRQKHKTLTESKTIDLPLPGYDGMLVVRYRVLDADRIGAIARRNATESPNDQLQQGLLGSMDAMSQACEGIFYNDGEQLRPLSEDPMFNGDVTPVRYDAKLAKFMGWDDEEWTARTVISRLFDDVDTMILDHGSTLSRWMTNITRKAGDTFLGGL